MEPFELTAMRLVAKTVNRWKNEYRDEPNYARSLVLEMMVISEEPFRSMYLTAFGR